MTENEAYRAVRNQDALEYVKTQSMLAQMVGSETWKHFEYASYALKKQIPKKPIHVHEVYPKHDWKLDKNGEVDMWALSVGYCNGPMCNRCHTSVCEHCNPDWDEEECVIDEHRCPNCNEEVHYVYDTDKFCRNCGQALDWS